MQRALLILVLVSISSAQYKSRCGLENEVGMTLNKTADEIDGRYTVEWCSKLNENATEWSFKLEYIDFHNGSKQCPQSETTLRSISLSRFLTVHSAFVDTLQRPFPDCNITCLSKPLDLLFTGCYMAQSQLTRPSAGRTWRREVQSLRVDNRFDSAQAINKIRPFHYMEKIGNTLTVTWDLHYIPVLDYTVEIADYDNKTHTEKSQWRPIDKNCTHETYSVACALEAPPAARCVACDLRHDAPWRRGILFRDANYVIYCTPIPKSEPVLVRLDGRVWWAVGAFVVAVAALAACWAAHSRLLAALRKRVLWHWIHRYAAYTERAAGAGAGAGGPVLLLYARDCPAAMAAVGLLRDMLEDGAPGQVFDIFAPECVALYAASPAEWLRALLARPDVRVLLVQTPAAAALYGAQDDDSLRLAAPLLGGCVQYRRPHFGDALLQLALRLLRDAAHAQPEYTKYYVATIAELQSELMPQVAAYRRYVLPAHAPLLLADLHLRGDPQRAARLLQQLTTTIHRLQEYVRANENYLRDELMFL